MLTRVSRRAALSLVFLAGGLGVFTLLSGACHHETAGETSNFEAAFGGGTAAGTSPTETFTTYAGWTVQLTRALVAVGPVYYYEGAPEARLLDTLVGMRTAHACPTHAQFNKGTVLGEIIRQYGVNLLGAPTQFGTVPGFAGVCRSVEVHFHPLGRLQAGPSSTPLSDLQSQTFLLEGQATKEGVSIPFRAHLSLPEEGIMQVVESIAASVTLRDSTAQPGFILVEALMDQWFATVDFGSLTDVDGDTRLFTDSTQAWTALIRGIRSRQSYRVSWRSS